MTTPIEFRYEQRDETSVFFLKSYPEIAFKFKEGIKFGTPDEENLIPVIYEVDIVEGSDEILQDSQFEYQVSQLLSHLLTEANNHAYQILNDPSSKTDPLTNAPKPVIVLTKDK